MNEVERVLESLNDLCSSIKSFKSNHLDQAIFSSPIIDHFHPDDYDQRGITGLNKFLGHAETERDYVQSLVESGRPPKELATNAPNLIAVWDEFLRSPWPICSIAQHVDCGPEGQVKIDIVAAGGDQWVKVNTIKESRLMAEFREQDSYLNSDYDSDSDSGGSSDRPRHEAFSNSLIVQAEGLIRAAKAYLRPLDLPTPKIRFVLSRLPENPPEGYDDGRISKTFDVLRGLGVNLVLGPQSPTQILPRPRARLVPTKRIMLDLSIIVALCCDSTHQPLPRNDDELEARFRPLQRDEHGNLTLADHTNVSKDLRDQLSWEMEHPVVEEIQSRLTVYQKDDVEWYVTREVKDRTPGIVNLIGGPQEQARSRALYGESEDDFWAGSRYQGRQGVLSGLKVKVLEDEVEARLLGVGITQDRRSMFENGLISVCERMLSVVDGHLQSSSRAASPAPTASPAGRHRGGRGLRNKHSKRHKVLPQPQKLPSTHTLRTLLLGVKGGMTVLTNNRGAVGKIVREMGAQDGLPFDRDGENGAGDPNVKRKAVVWVVNPSSLAEWRRLEVERINSKIGN